MAPPTGAVRRLLLDLARGQHDDPAVRLDAHALGPDPRILEQRHVDDAALDGRHRLELNDLSGLDHALSGPVGHVAQLLLAAAPVVLDVDGDAMALALAATDDQVHEVLEACQLLATATDQNSEVVASDVEAGGLAAAGDLDAGRQLHELEHLGQHGLGGVERRSFGLGELVDRLARHEWRGLAARSITSWLAWLAIGPRLAHRVLAISLPAVTATPATAPAAARPARGVGSLELRDLVVGVGGSPVEVDRD